MPVEEPFEQQPEQLQRDILERQRRAVEQLEQPVALIELDQRRHRGVREAAIGLRRTARAVVLASSASPTNGAITAHRGIDIGQAAPAPRSRRGDRLRPAFGQIEPAVAGEAGERDAPRNRATGALPRVLI